MKKYSLVFLVGLMLITLFIISCNKDYYDPDNVIYSISLPDTVYLNIPVTIKGSINEPLDIRVFINDFAEKNLIGIIRHGQDSISWIPSNLEEGEINLFTIVNFETKKSTGYNKTGSYRTFVKKQTERQ